jgi:hypothetical protein
MADELPEIDWSAAEVQGGKALLPLTESVAKAWRERFEGVLELLGQGSTGWGRIELTKKAINVADLEPGSEDELRHLLESVLLQVNTELHEEPEQATDDPDDARARRDRQITEKLRSFSPTDS